MQRDKINMDILWLKDESLEDSENLPEPEILAQEIVENLQSALEQFSSIYEVSRTEASGSDRRLFQVSARLAILRRLTH